MDRLLSVKPGVCLLSRSGYYSRNPAAPCCELIRMHREESLDFGKVTTFNLDEYVGLSPEHPATSP